ncbi:hypothetical protein CNMCM6936_008156 [Aspergillus lentulus]|uniref:Carrier domain-containing protein n=1 Tax=Aspergillus lentulus TaxID=293939 RepID=A0AAN6BQW8_ASPLE|nr:hypothetical protein CNMCM6936_008156 [Aspergillus lentulus]KAF4206734.1 hypothetical protein CNMCM8927_004507 [Aspergillus lentulus]
MTAEDGRMRRIMAKALGVDTELIRKDSNFFEIGGDSFAAQQLVNLALDEGVRLTVEDIFNNPTWSDLVRIFRERTADTTQVIHTGERNTSLGRTTNGESLCRDLEGNIADGFTTVRPTTEFQRWALFSMYFRYFRIPLPSTIDRARLLAACRQLIGRHESLRTAFFIRSDAGEQKVLQGILAPFDLEFKETDGVSCLDQYCDQDTMEASEPPVDGKPPFQAHLVSLQDGSLFLVLRFSHAQWDGCSLASIADDLSAFYNNNLPLPPTAQFFDHARAAWASQTGEAYNTWRQLLSSAKMTTLRGHRLPLNDAERGDKAEQPYSVKVTKNIPLPLLPANISMATLIRSAWAVILRRFFTQRKCTVSEDVVFGHVTNGRGLAIPHDDRIVGPCANIIPVRVQFNESMTKLDLLHQVQQQYLKMRPYENMEFGQIVKHCTSWPLGIKYGSFVRVQNYDFSPTCVFDDVPCKGNLYSLPNRPSDTANLAVFPFETELSILMTVSSLALGQKEAEFVIDEFCKVVQELSGSCDLQTRLRF